MDTGVDYDQEDLYENIWINQAEIPKSRLAPSLGGTNPNGIQDYYHDGYVSWRDLNDPRNIGPGKITDVNGDGIIDAADILAPMVLNSRDKTPASAAGPIPAIRRTGIPLTPTTSSAGTSSTTRTTRWTKTATALTSPASSGLRGTTASVSPASTGRSA